MTSSQLIQWMIHNLPEWPTCKSQGINIPCQQWEWMHLSQVGMYALNVETGECVFEKMFLDARADERLCPAGVSFKELIDDLKFDGRHGI